MWKRFSVGDLDLANLVNELVLAILRAKVLIEQFLSGQI